MSADPGSTPGERGLFREAALRAHLARTISAAPEEDGPGRMLLVLWALAFVLAALAALVVA